MTQLDALDYTVIFAYLAGTVALGLWIGRRIHTGTDYFLAGRTLPWWAIGMSLVATDIGATDIIGAGGAGYRYGLAVGNFEWIGCVPAMIVAAFVFIPFFWRIGVYTIPEYLERRFGPAVRTALAVCWLLFMAANIGVMLLASARMAGKLLGWDETLCIVATAMLVGVYTTAGGLGAVVYTDVVQCSVMIVGCLAVLVMGLIEIGGPAQLQSTQLVLPVDSDTPFPWPGILFGLALILSPAYWIGNQAIVQRSLGARTEFQAKAAYVWGALLKNVIPIVVVVPGLIAASRFPGLKIEDEAYPTLVGRLLPHGLRGAFLAAFLAALMSSVDSYLNSASTIFTNDLYRRFIRPDAGERRLLLLGRSTTVVLVLWAIAFAFVVEGLAEGLYAIFQTLMAFFQGPALAVLMAGLLWWRATARGALVGFLGGVMAAVGLFSLSQEAVYKPLGVAPLFKIQEPFLYYSIWAFLTAAVLIVAVSLLTPPDDESKLRYMIYRRRPVRDGETENTLSPGEQGRVGNPPMTGEGEPP